MSPASAGGCRVADCSSPFTSTCKFLLIIWILFISVTDVCCELNKNYSFDTAKIYVKIDISCKNTKQSVGVLFTNTNHITLKYKTDGWGTDSNGFKLVITAIKDPKHSCRDFRCAGNGYCIHPELLCDGVNHCSDASDESVNAKCQNTVDNLIFGMELTWIVLITVCSLLIIFACLVGIAICICRRNPINNSTNNNSQINNGNGNFNQHQQLYQTNLNATNGSKHSTLPREQTTRLPSEKMMLGENGMNGNHTIPRNFNLCLEATSIDGPSAHLKSLMGQDLLPQTNQTTKDEWFV